MSGDVCRALCSGTKVDVDNASQRTGLHEATEGNHVDVIELLLKQSEADPAFHDSNENSAYDIAYTNKNEEVRVASFDGYM